MNVLLAQAHYLKDIKGRLRTSEDEVEKLKRKQVFFFLLWEITHTAHTVVNGYCSTELSEKHHYQSCAANTWM